jgi:hypothetical protein
VPHRVADLGHAKLGGGRHILQLLEPFRRRNGDAVKRSGLNLRQRVGHLIPQEIDLPGQEIADGRS